MLAVEDRLAFAIRGQGVKVESENEHLTAQGERVHTGQSEPLNRQVRPELHRAFRRPVPQVSDLRRAAEPVRPGPGRRPAARGGPGRADRLAPDLLRRSAGLPGRVERGPEGGRNGRQLPGRQPHDVRGGGERGRSACSRPRWSSAQAIEVESYPRLENQRPAAAAKPAAARSLVVGLTKFSGRACPPFAGTLTAGKSAQPNGSFTRGGVAIRWFHPF